MATLFSTPVKLFPLRGRQPRAIDELRQAIREGHKRIILQSPTGTGKTIMASHIISLALDKGNRPLFTVPQLSLIDQTIQRFEAQGICDIGVIQAQHARTDGAASVQLASVQTMVRRALPDVDVVLIDECHLQFNALNEVLDSEEWKNKVVIGLSATPWVKGMGRRWTKLVCLGSTKEMIAEGWLTSVTAFSVPDGYLPDRSKVPTNFTGEYAEAEAESAMSTAPIVGNVVRTWMEGPRDHEGRIVHPPVHGFTFMFCVTRSHARMMQQEFEDAGVPCGYIDGTMDADQREAVFRKYRAGEYKIIASVGCLVVGVDERVDCIIFLVLTKSEIKWVQAGGRGLRLADGKDHLLLLDHCGTCEELGVFTDIHHETLDKHDPKEKGQPFADKKAPKPHKCPKCNVIVKRGVPICPVCNYKFPAKSPRHIDGELALVKGGKQKEAKPELPRAEWFGGLLWIAQERGYKDGWAANKYRDKFGVWPNGMAKTPVPPKAEVMRWEKYTRIRWAKSKQKTEREVINA